jgi:hypothetical protein
MILPQKNVNINRSQKSSNIYLFPLSVFILIENFTSPPQLHSSVFKKNRLFVVAVNNGMSFAVQLYKCGYVLWSYDCLFIKPIVNVLNWTLQFSSMIIVVYVNMRERLDLFIVFTFEKLNFESSSYNTVFSMDVLRSFLTRLCMWSEIHFSMAFLLMSFKLVQ